MFSGLCQGSFVPHLNGFVITFCVGIYVFEFNIGDAKLVFVFGINATGTWCERVDINQHGMEVLGKGE